ncbi:MAG: hypothetical protein ACXWAV_10765 [Chthoniobacterales bacterium]
MSMRIVVCLLVLAAVGAFLAHRNKEETPAVVAEQKPAQVESSPAPHENNPHNWMKNSLDRAADVKRQVQQQRKENSTN